IIILIIIILIIILLIIVILIIIILIIIILIIIILIIVIVIIVILIIIILMIIILMIIILINGLPIFHVIRTMMIYMTNTKEIINIMQHQIIQYNTIIEYYIIKRRKMDLISIIKMYNFY